MWDWWGCPLWWAFELGWWWGGWQGLHPLCSAMSATTLMPTTAGIRAAVPELGVVVLVGAGLAGATSTLQCCLCRHFNVHRGRQQSHGSGTRGGAGGGGWKELHLPS